MSETAQASDIHPDVLKIAQAICDKVHELTLQVETLDANNWLKLADEIDALNSQLQALLIPAPPAPPATTTKTITKSNS